MPVTTEFSQAQLVLTMEAMLVALSCGSRALMKVRVLGWLMMVATLAVFRPGMRVPVSQPVRPVIMVLTVAGVILLTTELSQAQLVLTMEAMLVALSCGSRVLMKVRVLGWLMRVAMLAVFRPGMRVPVSQAVSPLIMVFTVAGVMLVTTELSQFTLELTMEAMEAGLSCGSRALMKAVVLAWLAMTAMLAVFRPGMRVPVR